MNELTKKYGAPALPSVNLLPTDIAEKRKTRAVQVTALIIVLIAIGVVALGYVLALGSTTLASSNRDNALGDQTIALDERNAKVNVYDDYREREVQEYALSQIGVGEADYATFSAAIFAATGDSISLDEILFLGPSALGAFPLSEDPVSGGGLGSIQFTGRAVSPEEADAFATRFEAVPGVANVTITMSAYLEEGGTTYVGIEGTAAMTEVPLTLRLLPEDGITDLSPDVALSAGDGEPPAPAPAPSPTPSPSEEEN